MGDAGRGEENHDVGGGVGGGAVGPMPDSAGHHASHSSNTGV